ncbi:hypothetical protein JCM11491_005302 [Sporobolomyces phaffii]
MRYLSTLLALATLFSLSLAAAETTDAPEEERNIAGFTPKLYLSVIGIAAYAAVAAVHWTHFFRNRDNKYNLTLCIGMACMVIGFVLRILYANDVSSVMIYSVMTLFLLLSPCTFLAINYVLLTRLADALGAESALFIRASWVVKIFIWSDVVSFFALASGGGMSVSENLASIGHNISMVGLVLQVVSYGLFCALLIVFGFRVPRMFPHIRSQIDRFHLRSYRVFATSPVHDWRVLFAMMLLSSVGIIVRCGFRLVEYSQGYDGYLARTEAYFYLLDALPLLVSMSLYALFWPPRFVAGARATGTYETLDHLPLQSSYPHGATPTSSSWNRTDYNAARHGKE